jgi:KaiC/GvpD/RAD55 family RecA-like ATPase
VSAALDDDGFPAEATKVRPIKPFAADPPFPVEWVASSTLDFGARPIVKGLIEPGAFVVIYGPSGSGKSFFTADLAEHVAMGTDWRGRKVKRGFVVYVASEAGGSIMRRFLAWRDNRLSEEAADNIPLAVITRGPNLLASVDVQKLIETLVWIEAQAEEGEKITMVVFDTLSRSMHGGDENKAEDMTMAVSAADQIRERFNAATVFVHHSGKDPTKGARGHSALFAAADLVMSIDNHTATVEKVRDGVTGERFAFKLEPVQIGTDADGDPVMTCLLNAAADQGKEPCQAIGKNQRIVLEQLRSLVADSGITLPGTSAIPAGVKAVRFDDLLSRCRLKFTGLPDWRIRDRLGSSLASLQAARTVGVHDTYIWLV